MFSIFILAYVRTKGRAEIFKFLFKYGKFPALEKNWKPSDFNLTNFLIWSEKPESVNYFGFKSNMVEDMLHFELKLSQDLTTEILEDYKQFKDSNRFKDSQICLNETTTRYVFKIYDLKNVLIFKL